MKSMKKSINETFYYTHNIQMWKEFDRNMDCTSIGSTDIALRFDFENCTFTFFNAIVKNKKVRTNVLILLCKEWNDQMIWTTFQKLICSDNAQHFIERYKGYLS